VERIVEGNANVRANFEEVNGEDIRVWRWIGTSTPLKRRASLAGRSRRESLVDVD